MQQSEAQHGDLSLRLHGRRWAARAPPGPPAGPGPPGQPPPRPPPASGRDPSASDTSHGAAQARPSPGSKGSWARLPGPQSDGGVFPEPPEEPECGPGRIRTVRLLNGCI